MVATNLSPGMNWSSSSGHISADASPRMKSICGPSAMIVLGRRAARAIPMVLGTDGTVRPAGCCLQSGIDLSPGPGAEGLDLLWEKERGGVQAQSLMGRVGGPLQPPASFRRQRVHGDHTSFGSPEGNAVWTVPVYLGDPSRFFRCVGISQEDASDKDLILRSSCHVHRGMTETRDSRLKSL
jgi:hypothetical protein